MPGTVPIGTYLYHARNRRRVPTIPDWVAMNPEESTFFCMGPAENGCWHLTLVMTRPLKVLYFDGSSAAKLDSGTMDTQDVLTWGKGLLDKTWMEQERIAALCEWGNQYRVDGFIRMEMDLYLRFTSERIRLLMRSLARRWSAISQLVSRSFRSCIWQARIRSTCHQRLSPEHFFAPSKVCMREVGLLVSPASCAFSWTSPIS